MAALTLDRSNCAALMAAPSAATSLGTRVSENAWPSAVRVGAVSLADRLKLCCTVIAVTTAPRGSPACA